MANCSPSPSEEGEPGSRRPPPQFLSHLHTRRASGRDRTISTNSNNLISKDQAPVDPGWVVPPPKRRSLAVSFGMTHPGDANMDNSSVGGRGTSRQQHEEASGASSTSSCASSKTAVARILPDQATSLLGRTSRFRGSTVLRDTWSEHTGNPDGEFTFRCSSTMHKARAANESSGFDLVGAVICGTSESPVSSISSHRYSGKRCVYSWSYTKYICYTYVEPYLNRCRRIRFCSSSGAGKWEKPRNLLRPFRSLHVNFGILLVLELWARRA